MGDDNRDRQPEASFDSDARFVLGLDLDGVCADFYEKMREIVSEWIGSEAAGDPVWGLGTWGLQEGEYDRVHRFAVTQRALFSEMLPIAGAPQAIRRLGTEGVRIRIITHRLFIRYFHETAVVQTVRWLDHNAIPYWDLCFMRDKGEVGADLYVEDAESNILALRRMKRNVLIFDHPTNQGVPDQPGGRASGWPETEAIIREQYYQWLTDRAWSCQRVEALRLHGQCPRPSLSPKAA